jgi:hypothetical protein
MQRTVQVTGIISPISTSDKYPVIDPLLGIDGLRCVSSLTDMYNIPLERRRGGMLVGVQNTFNNTTIYYSLKPGVTWSVGPSSSTDWVPYLGGTGSTASAITIKYNISNETITVPLNYEYLLYGDLNIGTAGNFINYGKTVLINGNINLIGGGTYSNFGTINTVTIAVNNKYSSSFGPIGPGATLSINHALNTTDIIYTIRDGYNFVYPNVEIIDSNNVLITTAGTISSGRINIIS